MVAPLMGLGALKTAIGSGLMLRAAGFQITVIIHRGKPRITFWRTESLSGRVGMTIDTQFTH